MTETKLEQWVKEYGDDPEFVAEGLAIDVVEEVLELLEERGEKQSWLAEKMGVSRQSISRMFNATPNLTLLSIARLAVALGVTPRVILDSEGYIIRPINEDWETFVTDAAIQRHNYLEMTDTTANENPIGERGNATALA